jgi:hypothetical protein
MNLNIRVIPNVKSVRVDKDKDGTLKVSIKGKPFGGEASLEVAEVLSVYLKTPKNFIKVVKGATSRNKVVEVSMPRE